MITPTMYELLDDPVYRAYVKTIPRLSPNLVHGFPWQVWALTNAGTWKGGKFATYATAWGVVVKVIRNRSVEDVALISRRQFFGPPPNFTWGPSDAWCPRCRRPSRFRLATQATHHALRGLPAIATEDRRSCVYCGIRWIAIPSYQPLFTKVGQHV